MQRLSLIFPVLESKERQLHDVRSSNTSLILSGMHSVVCIHLHYALHFWS
jgi:hypothetical protein